MIDTSKCEAYFIGEIRPLIFEVYTESGIPFTLINIKEINSTKYAYCEVKDEEGEHLDSLPVTVISDEPANKKLLVSWDTSRYSVGYYRLQIWVLINISGATDDTGQLIVEAKLATEDLLRYLKT